MNQLLPALFLLICLPTLAITMVNVIAVHTGKWSIKFLAASTTIMFLILSIFYGLAIKDVLVFSIMVLGSLLGGWSTLRLPKSYPKLEQALMRAAGAGVATPSSTQIRNSSLRWIGIFLSYAAAAILLAYFFGLAWLFLFYCLFQLGLWLLPKSVQLQTLLFGGPVMSRTEFPIERIMGPGWLRLALFFLWTLLTFFILWKLNIPLSNLF